MQHRYDLRRDTDVCGVKAATDSGDGVSILLEGPYGETTVEADLMLVATGRRPNSDRLNLAAAGVTINEHHLIIVDEYQETVVPGIFALGDISSPYALKHVANHEARIVRHNLLHPDDRWKTDHRFVPAAVFTDPQIAAVGLTEEQAQRRAASTTSWYDGTTAAPRPVGRGRTPPDSSRSWPTRRPGCCSARTSSARKRRP